jgi:hypothetical protein
VQIAIATSPDGQWVAVKQGAKLTLYTIGGQVSGTATLSSADADLAIVGPPIGVVAVERNGAGDGGVGGETAVIGLAVPGLGETARFAMSGAHELAAVTGPRLALVGRSNRSLAVLRAAGRAFMSQPCDPGGAIELIAGLERNQLLVVLPKRMEVWDAVSCRPVLRPTFTLPPAPRRIGSLAGHVWAYRPGTNEVVLFRLSDGRAFAHRTISPVEDVISHPTSPYLVARTSGGLLRVQAFAHTSEEISAPPADAYAIAGASAPHNPTGTPAADLTLVGVRADEEPWSRPLVVDTQAARPLSAASAGASPAPAVAAGAAVAAAEPTVDGPMRMRLGRDRPAAAPLAPTTPPAATSATWRDALVDFAAELRKEDRGPQEVPAMALGTSLSQLCHRAELGTPARRALTVLYAAYLGGEPAVPMGRLARLVGGDPGWAEALGTGELAERGLVASRGGRVALVDAIARAIDGAAPRAYDVVGDGTPGYVAGGRILDPADASGDGLGEPITAMTAALGRFALVTGPLTTAVLEAYARGLVAVAIAGTGLRLRAVRVPRGAGLIVIAPRAELPPAMAMWPTLET